MSKKQGKIKKTAKKANAVKPKSAKPKTKQQKVVKVKKTKLVAKKAIVQKPVTKNKVIKNVKKKTASIQKVGKVKAFAKKIVKNEKKKNKLVKLIKTIKQEKLLKPTKYKKEEKQKKIKSVKEEEVKIAKTNPYTEKNSKPKRGRKRKAKGGDDEEPEIIHDELVEQLINATKKLKNQPKKPKILKTFVNPITSLTVAIPENQAKKGLTKKEPKGKFELEYVVRTSAGILYEFLTTPSGLSEWFADDVNIQDGIFTFFWDGSEQKARLLGFKEEKHVRFQWLEKLEGSYFEFKIQTDELTGDVSLIITDFADEASDFETSKRLWDTQVEKLLHIIGSY